MWFWLCASVLLNGVLAIYAIHKKRESWTYRKEAASEKLVSHTLAAEVARKLGPHKAMRLAHSVEIAVRQSLQPKESGA